MTAPDRWRKPSRCGDSACVEVMIERNAVLVRWSERPSRWLEFNRAEWVAFLAGAKDGEFDLD